MLPHRDSMVRRAVARHIICQVRRRQAAKHRRLLGRRELSACDASLVACSSDSDSSYAATEPELATTAAAISALATAMAATRTDPRAEQFAQYERLLELFSFGVLNDYKTAAAQFPQLSPQQLNKLKHLTLVTLASNEKVLHYDMLIAELDCSSEQEMEDLVIEAIYKNILMAKLDQKRRLVEVDFTVGRDVRKQDLPDIFAKLEAWSNTCDEALEKLSADIETVNAEAAAKLDDSRNFTNTLQELRSNHVMAATEGLPRSDSQYESSEYQREAQRVGADAA
ncbi:COP9 signalosome complex subunit 7b [Coemansia sp. RSA 1972]|nr:COP9 signalosome complex subunit 7b [Coemansia sp. RSA 1972]